MVKILLGATFSGIPLTESFSRDGIHSENSHKKSFVAFFSGRFDVHLKVMQPILKCPYLISLIKYPQVRHFNKKITLKNVIIGLH